MEDSEKLRIQGIIDEGFPLYEEACRVLYRNDVSQKLTEDEWRAVLIYRNLVNKEKGIHPCPKAVKFIIKEVFDTTIDINWTENDLGRFNQSIDNLRQKAIEGKDFTKPGLSEKQWNKLLDFSLRLDELKSLLKYDFSAYVTP